MAKVEHTLDAPVLGGIDISKHRHEVLIAIPGKRRRRRLTITDTLEDFHRLVALLGDYQHPVQIGFEGQGTALAAIIIAHSCISWAWPALTSSSSRRFEITVPLGEGLALYREALLGCCRQGAGQ